MIKTLMIIGPFSVGKTELAASLAEGFNGELINADSVQIYKGLDIIAGKDVQGSRFVLEKRIKFDDKTFDIGYYLIKSTSIYLLDVVSSDFDFNVSYYIKLIPPTIQIINKKGKLPIITGGAGFYTRALIDGIGTLAISPDLKLRRWLDSKTVNEVIEILKNTDLKKYDSMNNSDRKNKRRLIRAIEIAKFKNNKVIIEESPLKDQDVLIIGLTCSKEVLKERINRRIDDRVKNGAFEEAERLFVGYNNISSHVKNTNGYRQLFEFCSGKVTRDEAIENWRKSEFAIAKKQMTWFKKEKRIRWFDIEKKDLQNVEKTILEWKNN